MEDVQRRVDIKLITEPSKFIKHVSKVTYKRSVVFTNDEEKEEYLVGLEAKKTLVKLDKPIYTGFTVLELSKLHMYDYHYNHVMKKYGPSKAKLLFTDTDSLTYLITTGNIYQDMKHDEHLYDFSEYPKDHLLFSESNKKVIGKFKDETAGVPIVEFVGLRAKMYSMLAKDAKKDQKKGKGIKKSVLKKDIKHQDFKDCLFEKREYQHSMMGFRSHQHQLYTEKQTKKSLSPFDDKRYILEDGYTTRAHGHHQNNITRPSEAAKSAEEGLINILSVITKDIPPPSPKTTTDIPPPSPKTTMDIPPPPPVTTNSSTMSIPPPPSDITNSRFHKYLPSFWE